MKRGNARGAKGAGHPRQDGVNGQPDELLVLMEGGSLLFWGGTSRMNREVHVRICEGLGVKVPGPTRRGDIADPRQSLPALRARPLGGPVAAKGSEGRCNHRPLRG